MEQDWIPAFLSLRQRHFVFPLREKVEVAVVEDEAMKKEDGWSDVVIAGAVQKMREWML